MNCGLCDSADVGKKKRTKKAKMERDLNRKFMKEIADEMVWLHKGHLKCESETSPKKYFIRLMETFPTRLGQNLLSSR